MAWHDRLGLLGGFPAALLTLQLCGAVPVADRGGLVEALGETRVPFARADPTAMVVEPRVERAYFDARNELRWDDRKVHEHPEISECDATAGAPGRFPSVRRTRLAAPRVDERACPGPRGRLRKTLVGIDAAGRVTWERPLVFLSGDVPIELWLVGAAPEGLVLSDLEVWSPGDGRTLVPARSHVPAGADRPVPDHDVSGGASAVYVPERREVLVFQADVTLVRREGGLHRIDLETGRRQLAVPVSATIFGTYDRVESMALSRDGRFVLLGARQDVRGAASVSVAVLEAATGASVYQRRHGQGHACAAPQVVAGADGRFGFAYRDETAAEHVLVLHR